MLTRRGSSGAACGSIARSFATSSVNLAREKHTRPEPSDPNKPRNPRAETLEQIKMVARRIIKAERDERMDITAQMTPVKTYMGGFTRPSDLRASHWFPGGTYIAMGKKYESPNADAYEPHIVYLLESRYPVCRGLGRTDEPEYIIDICKPANFEAEMAKYNSQHAPPEAMESMDNARWPWLPGSKSLRKKTVWWEKGEDPVAIVAESRGITDPEEIAALRKNAWQEANAVALEVEDKDDDDDDYDDDWSKAVGLQTLGIRKPAAKKKQRKAIADDAPSRTPPTEGANIFNTFYQLSRMKSEASLQTSTTPMEHLGDGSSRHTSNQGSSTQSLGGSRRGLHTATSSSPSAPTRPDAEDDAEEEIPPPTAKDLMPELTSHLVSDSVEASTVRQASKIPTEHHEDGVLIHPSGFTIPTPSAAPLQRERDSHERDLAQQTAAVAERVGEADYSDVLAETSRRKGKLPFEIITKDGLVTHPSGFEPPTAATDFPLATEDSPTSAPQVPSSESDSSSSPSAPVVPTSESDEIPPPMAKDLMSELTSHLVSDSVEASTVRQTSKIPTEHHEDGVLVHPSGFIIPTPSDAPSPRERESTERGLAQQTAAVAERVGEADYSDVSAETSRRKGKLPFEIITKDGLVTHPSGFEPPTAATDFPLATEDSPTSAPQLPTSESDISSSPSAPVVPTSEGEEIPPPMAKDLMSELTSHLVSDSVEASTVRQASKIPTEHHEDGVLVHPSGFTIPTPSHAPLQRERESTERDLAQQTAAVAERVGEADYSDVSAETSRRKGKLPFEIIHKDGSVAHPSGFEPPTAATEFPLATEDSPTSAPSLPSTSNSSNFTQSPAGSKRGMHTTASASAWVQEPDSVIFDDPFQPNLPSHLVPKPVVLTQRVAPLPPRIRKEYIPTLATTPFWRPLIALTFPTRPIAMSFLRLARGLDRGTPFHAAVSLLDRKVRHSHRGRCLRLNRFQELAGQVVELLAGARGGFVGIRFSPKDKGRAIGGEGLDKPLDRERRAVDVGVAKWYGRNPEMKEWFVEEGERRVGNLGLEEGPFNVFDLDDFGRRFSSGTTQEAPWPKAKPLEIPDIIEAHRKLLSRYNATPDVMTAKEIAEKRRVKVEMAQFEAKHLGVLAKWMAMASMDKKIGIVRSPGSQDKKKNVVEEEELEDQEEEEEDDWKQDDKGKERKGKGKTARKD